MLDTLSHVRGKHGSARAYLSAGGVSDEQFDRLADRLLDAA